jgi:cytidylate kinase
MDTPQGHSWLGLACRWSRTIAGLMGTVTIAATYGCGGSIIAPAVAKKLALPFVDRAIPPALAAKIHDPLVAALADDADETSAVGRLLNNALGYTGLFAGVPRTFEDLGVSAAVTHTEEAIRHTVNAGGAVILGRAGVFVLKGRPDVLHVRLDGPIEARRRAAMQRDGLDYKTAARMQQATDYARRAYISHFYPREGAWEDPRHYHMVLDSTAISVDTCVEIITKAAKDLFANPVAAPSSQERG